MTVSLVSEQVLFAGVFLALVTVIHELTKRIKFPFTVALLILGLAGQWLIGMTGIHLPVSLSPDFIYFVLLPLLLFGSAMHLNLHQFRLQFKTITFLSTFGLLLGMAVVAAGVSLAVGLPLLDAMLFGALISATDPIAVLALFKQLGAPRRLAILADGESMFNDATAVIVFRILAGVVVAKEHISSLLFISGVGELVYVFVGSIVAGAVVGYLISQFIAWIQDDPMVETTLTLVAALMAFVAIEHFLHLSGVISSVVAGLVMGNWGRSRFSASVIEFVKTFWDYLGFVAVAVVFFFSALEMDVAVIANEPAKYLLVVGIVLLARAVSVYGAFYLTNKLPFFRDEPDVPLAWQHILNWGGLRGVIPLVLVFSLPAEYLYREEILGFTLATFVFTLFVNGTTIEYLLKRLRLHYPRIEEFIIKEQEDIFRAEEAREKLRQLPKNEFNAKLCAMMETKLMQEIKDHEKALLAHAKHPGEMENSLYLQTLYLQRKILQRLFREGHISENVMFDFETQLDLHADALEYPEKFGTRGLDSQGGVKGREKFEKRIEKLKQKELASEGVLKSWYRASWEEAVIERYSLMRVRVVTAQEVIEYLEQVGSILGNVFDQAVDKVRVRYEGYIKDNLRDKGELEQTYGYIIESYRQALVTKLISGQSKSERH